ncbi:type IV pilin [Methanonatronarchaeum thermophilum]|uniref:type IV pilin n=1 Tax=Methanonatronarchaeum thermophilum TaxID=1927129 RepID=UPI001374800D|nr:type IV pilin [Methanonatronarchaeum thermophilum]
MSPVIGVILLLGIVVLLASSVGVMVLGIGEDFAEPAPNVVLESDQKDGFDRITHVGGDTVYGENIEVKGGIVVDMPDSFGVGDSMQVIPTSDNMEIVWSTEESSIILKSISTSPVNPFEHEKVDTSITTEGEKDVVTFEEGGPSTDYITIEVTSNIEIEGKLQVDLTTWPEGCDGGEPAGEPEILTYQEKLNFKDGYAQEFTLEISGGSPYPWVTDSDTVVTEMSVQLVEGYSDQKLEKNVVLETGDGVFKSGLYQSDCGGHPMNIAGGVTLHS